MKLSLISTAELICIRHILLSDQEKRQDSHSLYVLS